MIEARLVLGATSSKLHQRNTRQALETVSEGFTAGWTGGRSKFPAISAAFPEILKANGYSRDENIPTTKASYPTNSADPRPHRETSPRPAVKREILSDIQLKYSKPIGRGSIQQTD